MTIEAPVNQSHHTDHIDHSDCIDHIVHNNHIEHIDNVNHKDQTISGSSLNKDGKSNATSSKIGMDSNTMFAPASTSAFCQSNPQMANRPDRALAAHFIPIDHATMSDVDHHRHHLKMDDAIAKSAEHRHLFSNVYQDHHRMRIAVLLQRTSGKAHYRNICAISKVASSCEIAEFIFLQESDAIQPPLSEWMLTHRSEVPNDGDDVVISHGDEGFGNMLKRKDIDAVYVVVPPGLEQKYVIQALDAKKHVLVKDPVSTYLGEFVEQLDHAKKQGKFIQFSTMFIHQYRVQRFMDRVLREELFGRINSIEADLLLNVDDLKKVGVSLPLSPQTGCIRSLGRFCILFSVLVFARVDSTATSARVIRYVKGANGELQSATCKIKFTKVSACVWVRMNRLCACGGMRMKRRLHDFAFLYRPLNSAPLYPLPPHSPKMILNILSFHSTVFIPFLPFHHLAIPEPRSDVQGRLH